jgi:segregation and condensation protein B
MLEQDKLKSLLEAILLAADKPMTEEQLLALFLEEEKPALGELRQALQDLQADLTVRSIELVQVASGYRFQIKPEWAPWVGRLWEEKAQRYSRALLETLALIAYRQPITRGEIEDIRGVTVSTSIIKTLVEDREWVRIVGHREVPGRPALYATTKSFLDYFGLKDLQNLPSLPEILNMESVGGKFEAEALAAELDAENALFHVSSPLLEMVEPEETAESNIELESEADKIEATHSELEVALEEDENFEGEVILEAANEP